MRHQNPISKNPCSRGCHSPPLHFCANFYIASTYVISSHHVESKQKPQSPSFIHHPQSPNTSYTCHRSPYLYCIIKFSVISFITPSPNNKKQTREPHFSKNKRKKLPVPVWSYDSCIIPDTGNKQNFTHLPNFDTNATSKDQKQAKPTHTRVGV